MNIESNIGTFMANRRPDARLRSFDYCFNYFQSHREHDDVGRLAAPENMQLSCLQLGFYLASWGMFRGSALLIGRSARQFEPVVKLIAETPRDIWEIDAHCYSNGACRQLVDLAERIRQALRDRAEESRYPSATLATKVMLGV